MQNDQQFLANTGMELLAFIGISDFNGTEIFYESALHASPYSLCLECFPSAFP